MSPQPEERRAPFSRFSKTFTKPEIDRMFSLRAQGYGDTEIGRRFKLSARTVQKLIGKRAGQ